MILPRGGPKGPPPGTQRVNDEGLFVQLSKQSFTIQDLQKKVWLVESNPKSVPKIQTFLLF